jgi:valyl-tRNA synthetase
MPSEALRNIRTMRQIKSGLDLANHMRVKTTNSLSKTEAEVSYLKSLTDGQAGQILAKERKRFATMEITVNKSRQRLLKARDKLAVTINKNRALTELRHELQQARLEGTNPTTENATAPTQKVTAPPQRAKGSTRKPKLRRVELKY